MKKSHRLLMAGAFGAGTFVAAHVGFDFLSKAVEQTNQPVLACAKKLGSKAITATSLPPTCSNEFSQDFNTRTSTISIYNAGTGNTTTESSKTIYYLPKKEHFLSKELYTPSEINATNRNMDLLNYGFDTVFAALFSVVVLSATKGYIKPEVGPGVEAQDNLPS